MPPAGYDVLCAELLAAGRDVTAERIDDADNGFRAAEQMQNSPEGLQSLFRRVVDWFLK